MSRLLSVLAVVVVMHYGLMDVLPPYALWVKGVLAEHGYVGDGATTASKALLVTSEFSGDGRNGMRAALGFTATMAVTFLVMRLRGLTRRQAAEAAITRVVTIREEAPPQTLAQALAATQPSLPEKTEAKRKAEARLALKQLEEDYTELAKRGRILPSLVTEGERNVVYGEKTVAEAEAILREEKEKYAVQLAYLTKLKEEKESLVARKQETLNEIADLRKELGLS